MTNISAASKIAILFVRPFRSYLDGYNLISKIRPSIEKSVKERLDYVVAQLQSSNLYSPQVDGQKELFHRMVMRILDSYQKSYETILPNYIDSLTVLLENELRSKYSEHELVQLSEKLNDPIVAGLLQNYDIFAILKKTEIQMDFDLQLMLLEQSVNFKDDPQLQDMLLEYKNKFFYDEGKYDKGFTDEDYFDEPDEDDTDDKK
jgi:hypothetical protein